MSGAEMTCRATASWGAAAPDWVLALAAACDESTQKMVSRRVGYSAATVSLVLGNVYRGDLTKVASAVRGALMNEVVACPVLGEISNTTCHHHQKAKFGTTSPQAVRLYRACRACPLRSGARACG